MAASKKRKQTRRPARPQQGRPQPPEGGPRRLGAQAQNRPQTSSAQRRYQRSHRKRSTGWTTWSAVGVVVIVVVVLVVVKLASHSSPGAAAAGRNPAKAPAAVVTALTTVPLSSFNSVGAGTIAEPFTVTKNQPPLTSGGVPRFVYEGAEYCPYCALMRWSLVAALARFGTFKNLKITSSSTDYAPVPTFSFLGSTYTSKYVDFTPYESADRTGAALQPVPNNVSELYLKYDGNGTVPSKPFSIGAGIPFLDIGNKYVSQGDPRAFLQAPLQSLAGGGPGAIGIADAIADPSSSVGKAIGAADFVAEANYISAAICSLNGGKPASVCASPGVQAALKILKKQKEVS